MTNNAAPSWTPDETQQAIISLQSGYHLVLAPPGCGKTQILAERICLALKQGRKAEDMLCLTTVRRKIYSLATSTASVRAIFTTTM